MYKIYGDESEIRKLRFYGTIKKSERHILQMNVYILSKYSIRSN